jgi:hypothetical protein
LSCGNGNSRNFAPNPVGRDSPRLVAGARLSGQEYLRDARIDHNDEQAAMIARLPESMGKGGY